jgi:hypothetical protein
MNTEFRWGNILEKVYIEEQGENGRILRITEFSDFWTLHHHQNPSESTNGRIV